MDRSILGPCSPVHKFRPQSTNVENNGNVANTGSSNRRKKKSKSSKKKKHAESSGVYKLTSVADAYDSRYGHVSDVGGVPTSSAVTSPVGGYVKDGKTWSSSVEILQLNPWKDGIHSTMKILDLERSMNTSIHTVHITFDESCVEHTIQDYEVIDLFESIGSDLPDLQHLTIQYIDASNGGNDENNNGNITRHGGNSDRGGPKTVTPPVQALRNVLMESKNLLTLTLLGINFVAVDDYDMKGFLESLRIHTRLKNFQMHSCSFAIPRHLESIKLVLNEKQQPNGGGGGGVGGSSSAAVSAMQHVDLDDNLIVDTIPSTSPLSNASSTNNTFNAGNEYWSGGMKSPYEAKNAMARKPATTVPTMPICGGPGAVSTVDNCDGGVDAQMPNGKTDDYITQIRTPPGKTDTFFIDALDDDDDLTLNSQTFMSWCTDWMCCQ